MKTAQSRIGLIFFVLGSLFLVGCGTKFNNLVDERIPQNASDIYTFSFHASTRMTNVIKGTEQAYLVINGEKLPMQKAPGDRLLFTYDYKFPAGVNEVRYYYELHFDYNNAGITRSTVTYSTHENYGRPYTARLINRYPIQLVSNRGRVGDSIALVGSGFTEMDVVRIGPERAQTNFRSPNAIDFVVPALDPNRSYPVVLETATGDLETGSFRVDEGSLTISPASLTLTSGDVAQLSFRIDGQAPAGGYRINVTTDVPTSVIIPEVMIPAGSSSAAVIIEGGAAGAGTLYVEAPGYGTREIPVTVQ